MPATYTVESNQELLAFLFSQCPEVKKTRVRQWLKLGQVQVNGRSSTRFDHPLEPGDLVTIRAKEDAKADSLLPATMRVVFEDADIIVIEKPERLLSMASATESEKTAYAFLTNYVRRGDPKSRERVWIVHRLDRDTSGLMVFAKTERSKQVLQENWYKTQKRYLAIVEGSPPADEGLLDSHLDENGPFRVYSAPKSPRTRHAVTRYRVLERMAETSLIEMSLETGRRNQIRVHLADVGCPIVGDEKYGAATDPVRRLALHSSSLELNHPRSGELLSFDSPLPHKLSRLVRRKAR
jgi:23S rRNA pseudouridine1911/1915/1917 synthase